MNRRIIKASAIQLLAHDRASLRRVWPTIAQRIRDAAKTGAQLVVLPEGTLPAYVLGPSPFDGSEIAQALADCGNLARDLQIVLVVGAARAHEGRVYNSAIVFDTGGEIAGSADKHFLWHFDRQWFVPAERLKPVQTSLGKLGVLICADGRIPTIARTLVDQGAEMLIMPTAWVTSGRDPGNLENIQADLLARVRARENGVPFVAANKCGVELECVAYCGKSQIVSAGGEIDRIASETDPEILSAEIELGGAQPRRSGQLRVPWNAARNDRSARLAISTEESFARDKALPGILEADAILTPATAAGHAACVADDTVFDPGGLAAYRLAGVNLVAWTTQSDDGWQKSFARARAIELRMYVIVFDAKAGRAYAVDPDGQIVCGTYGDYNVASFTFDPARTAQTMVAPGTDVLAGLERAHAHAR
ncbi:MAG TPA: carbon-nitrogen hydrolase family protein [Candidatus Rubrimentiphilum sp.]|nr:carbon-nitrogen hydrolase family protein [Candidatus Rubrimentiphilum sp.]